MQRLCLGEVEFLPPFNALRLVDLAFAKTLEDSSLLHGIQATAAVAWTLHLNASN